MRTPGKARHVLFGGALGGTKSYAMRWMAVRRLLEFAQRGFRNVPVALACESMPALRRRHVSEMQRLFPKWLGKYNVNEWKYKLHPQYGGGFIQLIGLDDAEKYSSDQYADIYIDELTFNSQETYTALSKRLRWAGIDDSVLVSATNPGRIGHCVPEGEVLTPTGWKDIRDFNIGDPVMTVLPTGEMVESIVEQIHRSHYSGKMAEVNARGLTMRCTPNHKVAKNMGVRAGKHTRLGISDKFSLVPFEKLPGQVTILREVSWRGNYVEKFVLPEYVEKRIMQRKRKPTHSQPDELPIDKFMALLGWFLSEGHTHEPSGIFAISQSKPQHRIEIEALIKDCGFKYHKAGEAFSVHSRKWMDYLRQFGKCRQKFIPTWVKNLPPAQLAILFDALVKGDGHQQSATGGAYYTISSRLKDDVAEVALKLGYIVHCHAGQRPNRDGKTYRVNFKKVKSGGTELLTGNHPYKVPTETKRRSDVQYEDFDGEVFCIGVPDTHNFIIRQRGSVWISGNSWVYDRFVNPKTRRPNHHFIQSLWSDNPFMPQSYWDDLIANLPDKVKRAMIDGDWSVFEGQYFTNLDEDVHYIPRKIFDKRWRRFRVIDWGYNHPCVCIWCTVSPDGVMYVYREHSVAHQTAEWHKRVIAEMSAGEEYDYTVVDPSLDRHDGSFSGNKTALEIFNDPNDGFGSFRCITADRDRIAGWHALLNAFEYQLADDGFAFKVAPSIFISHDCPHVWSSLRSLVYDEHNIEDVQKTKKHVYGPGQGDDEADCVRYAWKYCLKSPESRQSPIIHENIQRVGVASDGGWKDNPFVSKSPYARF